MIGIYIWCVSDSNPLEGAEDTLSESSLEWMWFWHMHSLPRTLRPIGPCYTGKAIIQVGQVQERWQSFPQEREFIKNLLVCTESSNHSLCLLMFRPETIHPQWLSTHLPVLYLIHMLRSWAAAVRTPPALSSVCVCVCFLYAFLHHPCQSSRTQAVHVMAMQEAINKYLPGK